MGRQLRSLRLPIVLARPYPVARLVEARAAIRAAARGDVAPLMALYQAATDALAALDPDEVADFRSEHPRAANLDRAAARAAIDVADTWEGIVTIGASIQDPRLFRGFAWLAAQARYEIGTARPDPGRIAAFGAGAALPGVSSEDAALYAALPALVGLGPELPDELPAEPAFAGDPVWKLLGLPDAADSGIDPLDGVAIAPEVVRSHYAALNGPWRALADRCLDHGLLIRPAEDLE